MATDGYIKKSDAENALRKLRAGYRRTDEKCAVGGCILEIQSIDTVDAEEVVRCKDCKWMVEFTGKDSGKPCGYGRCDNPIGLMGIVYYESYCSYPERKTDDLRA